MAENVTCIPPETQIHIPLEKVVADIQTDKLDMENIALVIPAYEPGAPLIRLLQQLCPHWNGPIIVVDDGSSEKSAPIFRQAEEMGARVLRHSVNLGKGRALKTAFNVCLTEYMGLIGCVTADADGQHLPEDILRCAKALCRTPSALILGCRDFSGTQVPWQNRLGNRMTCLVMRWFGGVDLEDTQTGLRGIPAGFMRRLMQVDGERYEFETNMLLFAKRQDIAMIEIPIETVYLDQNRASHFRPLRDGLRIYALFLRFSAVSLFCALVDLALFSLFVAVLRPLAQEWYIAAATVGARILSAVTNYRLNSGLVFEKRMTRKSGVGYFALCVLQMAASAGLVSLLFDVLHWPELLCKVIVDGLLFFVSFQIQNRWIFR